MGIGAKEGVIVFDNEQLAVTAQPRTRINHLAGGRRKDRLSQIASDINTLVQTRSPLEPRNYLALGGPLPLGCTRHLCRRR
jgi:hypothetical protein